MFICVENVPSGSFSDGAEIIEYLKSNIREETNVEFEFESEYEFLFEQRVSMNDYEKFNAGSNEIKELAMEHLKKLSPIEDFIVADLNSLTRMKMDPDGLDSQPEILNVDVLAVPMINGLPVYRRGMGFGVSFDNKGIISAAARLPRDLNSESIIASFSEEISYDDIMNALDDWFAENVRTLEVYQAYFLTKNNELIPIFVVGDFFIESRANFQLFRGDTGEVFRHSEH